MELKKAAIDIHIQKKLINLDLSLTLSTKNSKWIITINVKYKFFRMKT